ncbi:MAG: Flp pilus assembly protein CpaB [Chitinophagales bacterium]
MRNRRLLLLLALGSGLLTAVMVFFYTASVNKRASQPAFKMVTVVVARTPIPARTSILPAMLDVKRLPEPAVLPNYVRSESEVVGAVTRDALVAGEPVLKDRLWPKGTQPGLTFAIPAGKRAVTVAVNEVVGVAGFIKPGDLVDVLGTFEKELLGADTTATVLQAVQVLAIAQKTKDEGKDEAKVSTTVTLAVTLEEAQKLTLAEERGKLRLVLRPAGGVADLAKPKPATAGDLIGAPLRSAPAAQPAPAPTPPKPAVRVDLSRHTVEVFRGSRRDTVEVQ